MRNKVGGSSVPEAKEMKAVLSKLVGQLEAAVPYADALYTQRVAKILTKDKTGIESKTDADAGVKVRAFDGLQFHEVCVQGWDPALLQAEVQSLLTRIRSRQVTGKTVPLKIDREMIERDFATQSHIDPRSIPAAEKTKLISDYYERILKFSPEFSGAVVTYDEEFEQRLFVNRYKKLSSTWQGCVLVLMPFVHTPDGQTRFEHHSNFAHGFEVKSIPDEELTAFLQRAVKIKAAGRIPPGKYTTILSPSVSGLLAHESFGHGMESDVILRGRAKAEEYLGKKIASAKVSICDDGSIPSTHGHIFFDDEGLLPKRTYLVRAGIVSEPITESYSAAKRSFARTANARSESFNRKIYARMTNTFFLPGKDDVKAMIKEVKKGVLLHTASAGMEDPKGWGVQISGITCEVIKNGKLTGEFYYEASVTGYLPKILGNITAVSKDLLIKDSGFCGKGHKEMVRVSSGGPYIAIKELDLA
jgi:TldD protein